MSPDVGFALQTNSHWYGRVRNIAYNSDPGGPPANKKELQYRKANRFEFATGRMVVDGGDSTRLPRDEIATDLGYYTHGACRGIMEKNWLFRDSSRPNLIFRR
ncbi:hypothetical protein ANO14919_087880 [Xylariales sp. No.14919]|nr:hypothetical protein ANO14919_087880 [Xylariales sp. No.14919]